MKTHVNTENYKPFIPTINWGQALCLGAFALVMSGCSVTTPKTFTFQADVPEDFTVTGTGNYIPAPGETCTGRSGKPFRVGRLHFKPEQPKTAHQVEFKVPLTENKLGCSAVLHSLKLTIEGRWGPGREHTSQEFATFSISDDTSQQTSTSQVFKGQCQWLFRTMGPYRYIVKIPKCRALNTNGDMEKRMIGGRLHRDQLADSTVKLVLSVAKEEEPAVGDNWVKFPTGWKRCMGKGLDDRYGFCRGNTTDFKPFKMPDGRDCTVYPNCTE